MKSLFISIIVSVVFLSMMVGCKNRTDETFLNTIQKTRIYIPYKKMYICLSDRSESVLPNDNGEHRIVWMFRRADSLLPVGIIHQECCVMDVVTCASGQYVQEEYTSEHRKAVQGQVSVRLHCHEPGASSVFPLVL